MDKLTVKIRKLQNEFDDKFERGYELLKEIELSIIEQDNPEVLEKVQDILFLFKDL